jgi:hypothetical protein
MGEFEVATSGGIWVAVGAASCLKPGMSFQTLDAYVATTSDNEAARRLNEARTKLFQSIQRRSKQAA